ncbi:MAG: thymidylate synthase [Candidatus Zixiibacteriota bacterium]
MSEPVIIARSNISLAWAHAFLAVYGGRISTTTPLVVSAGDFDGSSTPEEETIRQAVDEALASADKLSCKMNADLIFPQSQWKRSRTLGRSEFFNRYVNDYYPRLRARDKRRNGKGTYFLRMIAWGLPTNDEYAPEPINQLEHVISMYQDRANHGMRPRTSALQIACFDPDRDHTRAARSIFPCLQQLGFVYGSANSLVLNAYYPSQYIFDRAYGNYLGLSHLGMFVAGELGLKFRRLTCFIGSPKLGDVKRGTLRPLAAQLTDIASQTRPVGAGCQ